MILMNYDQRSLVTGTALVLGDRLEPYWRHDFGHELHCIESASALALIFEHLLAICLLLGFWTYHLILSQNEIHHIYSFDTPDQVT